MHKLQQALYLICETDMSNRRIGAIVGIAYNTIAKYRRMLESKQKTWTDVQSMGGDEIERLIETRSQRLSKRRIPDWEYIRKELQRRDVTRALLWEEYRLPNPDDALSMSRFNELYSEWFGKLNLTMRQSHRAGECAFVDFAGSTIPWTDLTTGEIHQAQIFVGVLGCSNYTFAYAVGSQSKADFVDAHNKMFYFFGGAPQVVVPDNLKAAVTRPGREPEINRTFVELLRHYGAIAIPARTYRPRDKAKAEVAVQFVQRWVIACLRNVHFFSLQDINAAIAALLPRINEKRFRRLNGCRRSLFEELDKQALRDLPAQPFEYAEWISAQKVPLDYHVYVDKHYYSVPHTLVHEHVEAKITNRTVEIIFNNRSVATHMRSDVIGGFTTLPDHRPPSHRHFAEQTPEHFIEWARSIGVAATAAVQHQFDGRPHVLLGIRACSSLQRLAKDHGTERFEAACCRAKAIGSLTVKSIRSILQSKLSELMESDTPLQVSLPLHHNVRGASYYAVGGH